MGPRRGVRYIRLVPPVVGAFPGGRGSTRDLDAAAQLLPVVADRWKVDGFVSSVTNDFVDSLDAQVTGPEPERSQVCASYRKVVRLGAMVSLLEAEAELARAGKVAAPYWFGLGLLLAMLEGEFGHCTPGVPPFLIQAGYHLARHGPQLGPQLGAELLSALGV